jgi:hypothetical protein
MQIDINNKGDKQSYEIMSWKDVTLEKWVRLIEAEKEEEVDKVLEKVNVMSTIPKELVEQLSIQDVAKILELINDLQKTGTREFKRVIKVDGVEYGFIPDLEEITLGEYADIQHYIKVGIDNSMHKIMAVLYRPIVEKNKNAYSIEAYNSETMRIRADKFLEMKAIDVQAALVFFYNLANKLMTILPLYLEEVMKKLQAQTKSLLTNGGGSV